MLCLSSITEFAPVCVPVFASFRNRGIAFPPPRCYYAICPGTETHAVFPRESVPGNRNKDTEKRYPCALFLFSFISSLVASVYERVYAVYGRNLPCGENFKRWYNCVQKQENAVRREIRGYVGKQKNMIPSNFDNPFSRNWFFNSSALIVSSSIPSWKRLGCKRQSGNDRFLPGATVKGGRRESATTQQMEKKDEGGRRNTREQRQRKRRRCDSPP